MLNEVEINPPQSFYGNPTISSPNERQHHNKLDSKYLQKTQNLPSSQIRTTAGRLYGIHHNHADIHMFVYKHILRTKKSLLWQSVISNMYIHSYKYVCMYICIADKNLYVYVNIYTCRYMDLSILYRSGFHESIFG